MNSNRHPDRTKRGALGRLLALVALTILALAPASPARAQMGPSGSLTVQMRVGDALVEEALDGTVEPGAEQNLTAGSCSMIATTTLVDFGRVIPLPGNKLPPLPDRGAGYTVRCGTGPGCALTVCGGDPPPELIDVGISLSSTQGYVMRNPFTGTSIAYEVYDNNGTTLLSATGGGVTQGVRQTSLLFGFEDVSAGITLRVVGPSPSGSRLLAGTYQDTLRVTLSY